MALLLGGKILKKEAFTSKKGEKFVSFKVFDGEDLYSCIGYADKHEKVEEGNEYFLKVSASARGQFVDYFSQGLDN